MCVPGTADRAPALGPEERAPCLKSEGSVGAGSGCAHDDVGALA